MDNFQVPKCCDTHASICTYGDTNRIPASTQCELSSSGISLNHALAGSVKWGPISNEKEEEVEKVRLLLTETDREYRNLVTPKNLLESRLLQGMAGVIKGATNVVVNIDEAEKQKWLKEKNEKKEKGSRPKRGEKEGGGQATGKRPRDDDEGLISKALAEKRRALEEAHQDVMGTEPRLPPFDLWAPPKLPFGKEEVFAEGMEGVDFSGLRQQKKDVSLALHQQEVPLVNVFLEGVKSDPETLARTQTSSFSERVQKTILTSAYAFGEMYVHLAKADKEIERMKRREEMAKSKITEAQEAIQERNALLLQKVGLARGLEELKEKLASSERALAEAEQKKAEEIAAARAEAVESYRTSEELNSYIMDRLVDDQIQWEETLAKFNPSLDINFDTSGEPPSTSPAAEATEPTAMDAPGEETAITDPEPAVAEALPSEA